MAKKLSTVAATANEPAIEESQFDETLLTTAPDDWEFETVVDESPTKVIFDTVGDVFIGQFQERITIDPGTYSLVNGKQEKDAPFDLLTFRGRDGNLYSVNPSYKLDEYFETVTRGTWCRLTYIKDVPSKKGNPMKDLTVAIRKN